MDLLKRILRVLLWPVRRLLDPRFAGVNRNIDYSRERLLADIDIYATAASESLSHVGEELRGLEASIRRLEGRALGAKAGPAPESVEELDEPLAELLSREASYEGLAARAGLWFNPPVAIRYETGRVEVAAVNERIAEIPFAFRAMAAVAPGAQVLDVGSAESTLPLSLASLGYEVTALDPRPLALRHPRLTAVEGTLATFASDTRFDVVTCISSIEHFGLGAYGGVAADEAEADTAAMAKVRELLRAGGLLVLTVPYASRARVDELQRTYDAAGLDRLLEGWEVERREVVVRTDRRTWMHLDGDEDPGDAATAMVAARRR